MSIFVIGMALPTLAMKGLADDPEQTSGRAGSHFLPTRDAPAEGRLHHLLPREAATRSTPSRRCGRLEGRGRPGGGGLLVKKGERPWR